LPVSFFLKSYISPAKEKEIHKNKFGERKKKRKDFRDDVNS